MKTDELVEELFGTRYWLWMAERCYNWHYDEPHRRWEMLMYLYLFKWCGYEE